MLAMKPTPQESFSSAGSYRPSAGGRQECSRAGSAGFEAAAADSASVTMFSRSNSDPLISSPLNQAKGLTAVVGAPWAFAAPTGPPLVLREPQFHKFRPGRPTSPTDGLACCLFDASAPTFTLQSLCRVCSIIETAMLS